MANYNYSQLRKLWIKAGGNRGWSYVMAAVAMAESHGDPTAHHVDSNGTVDWGLWQINSSHLSGNIDQGKMEIPLDNAKEAVKIFNSSGPNAWSTYKSGAYKTYMPKGKQTPSFKLANPVLDGTFARVDQGVDYVTKTPVRAIAPGKIVGITSFAPGEGVASHTAIEEQFDHPFTIAGRTYTGGYYAEEEPLVKSGQHVEAGQDVMAAGSDELGFLIGPNLNFPPLVGGLGSGTQPTQAGKDYGDIVHKLGGPSPGTGGGFFNTITDINHSIEGWALGVLSPSSPQSNLIKSATGGWLGGVKALAYQGFFIVIGIALIVVGLALVAWALLQRVGAPGIIGMAQQQMRIGQSGQRIAESRRASMTREGQASQRIAGQGEQRQLAARRLDVQEKNVARRENPETIRTSYSVQERVVHKNHTS